MPQISADAPEQVKGRHTPDGLSLEQKNSTLPGSQSELRAHDSRQRPEVHVSSPRQPASQRRVQVLNPLVKN
ncbi:MAG: hypothetical protein JNM69_14835 [Archangium sp.]|nr:hypothetical protein [Archangium sp.]